MSTIVYKNVFDALAVGPPLHHQPGKPIGFDPRTDHDHFGRMDVAANAGAVPTFTPGLRLPVPGGGLANTGTDVTVAAPATTPQNPAVSETIYLTLPRALDSSKIYTAEVIFDVPHVKGGTPTWTVALNFKNGDITDNPNTDGRWGPSCQFSGAGAVKFHFTQSTDPNDNNLNGRYTQFNEDITRPVQFKLTAAVQQGANQTVQGTGSLSYENVAIAPAALKLQGQPVNWGDIKVVGLGLATTTGGTYGARLRQFTLSTHHLAA